MKIAFVTPKLGAFGGVETYVRQAASGLRERGHQCHLLFGQRTGREERAVLNAFSSAHPIREWQGGNTEPELLARPLAQHLHELEPDLVFLHKAEDLVTALPQSRRYAVVAMVHDHDLCCPRRHKYFARNAKICSHPVGWRCWLDAAFLERDREAPLGVRWNSLHEHRNQLQAHRTIDQLIVASDAMAQELVINGMPKERIAVVHPGTGQAHLEAVEPPSSSRQLLFVGQLIRGKGVDLMLRALAKLEAPFQASIVGDGNARYELEVLTLELGLAQRVDFVGWLAHHQLDELYRSARAVVVPSRWAEPFGLIGPEAMRLGRPVVGFDVGGIRDWLQPHETGLLTPAADIAGLAENLRTVLDNSSLADSLGAAAKRRYEDYFQLEHGIARLERALLPLAPKQEAAA